MAPANPQKPKSRSSASDAAARAWDQAIRWLAAHDRSAEEIRMRLAAAGVAPSIIQATVRRLHQLHYVDDRRFAQSAAEQAARRGHGSEYARAQLVAKGVADTLVNEALSAPFADEPELARAVLARRYATLPERPAERAKAARFLLRRGFPESVVFAILDEPC